mgnify:CR=1 FL=1
MTRTSRRRATVTAEPATLRGVVETVFYASPRFSAGRLRTPDGAAASFAGPVMIREHDPVVLTGAWDSHPKYGRQFKATGLLVDQDLDVDGLANYLANHPDVVGIGPVRAHRIAEAFGRDFDRVLQEAPERVAAAAGVSTDVVEGLREVWERSRALVGCAELVAIGDTGVAHRWDCSSFDLL